MKPFYSAIIKKIVQWKIITAHLGLDNFSMKLKSKVTVQCASWKDWPTFFKLDRRLQLSMFIFSIQPFSGFLRDQNNSKVATELPYYEFQ